MKEKTYSVIIVSDATSTNKEFSISSKFVRNALIACSVLLLVFGFMIIDYLTISFDRDKMRRIEKDYVNKEQTIAKLTSEIKGIHRKLARMEDFKKRIMVAVGLTSPYALTEVGVGGPEQINNFSTDIEMSKGSVNLSKEQINDKLVKEVEEFNVKAIEIEKSLAFVKEHINEQKTRLAHTPSLWPTRGYLTDSFGNRYNPITGKWQFHYGQDISTQVGNPIVATADGYVLIAEFQGLLGNLIHIDHGFGYQTRFGHLSSFNVKEGDRVKRGQVIGFVGSTGRSTAPHVHYEVIFQGEHVNPLHFVLD
ncbi:MAG: M23 family metallopeptidase [Candidatus Aminicenantes bacterium]|nr:M23 family metallopeptidase [Candidatus Aminicenantes bacterium]